MADYSIVGKRFGRLTVLGLDHVRRKVTYWKCKCDCGNVAVVCRSGLTSGDVVSCGCYRLQRQREASYKHGLSKTKLYAVWSGIVQRCTNPKAKNYERYGGRGIQICEDWRNDFKSFYDWSISNGYADGLTIDRKRNDGNYEPNNCRWVDRITQQNNRRNSNVFEFEGVSKTVTEWSRILGVNHETLRYRIKTGNLKDFQKLRIGGE